MSLVFDDVSFSYNGGGGGGATGTRDVGDVHSVPIILSATLPKTASQGIANITFAMEPGELLAVIGRSGSGKSTLLKLAAGLLSGHAGQIALGGRNMQNVPIWQREIGMVFQNYALFPHLSVLDNVAYGLRMRGVDTLTRRAQAAAMLERVGMSDQASRRPTQLSGGQQQRVALARALVISPRALLLDEPLAALDAGIRQQLRDEIRDLQRAHAATTLLVTHDQDEALSMADRVAVVDGGRLLQIDTPERLYHHPRSTQVARFIGQSTILHGRVAGRDEVDVSFAILHMDTEGIKPGTQVDVLLRPEYICPDPPVNSLNRIKGHRSEARYFGSTWRYDFQPVGSTSPLLCEGRILAEEAIAIAPAHLRLLPDSSPQAT